MSKFNDLFLNSRLYSGLMCSTYLEINLVWLMLLELYFHVRTYLAFVLLQKVLERWIIVMTSSIHGIIRQISMASLKTFKNLSWIILGVTKSRSGNSR